MHEPPLLVLDEPTSGLDPAGVGGRPGSPRRAAQPGQNRVPVVPPAARGGAGGRPRGHAARRPAGRGRRRGPAADRARTAHGARPARAGGERHVRDPRRRPRAGGPRGRPACGAGRARRARALLRSLAALPVADLVCPPGTWRACSSTTTRAARPARRPGRDADAAKGAVDVRWTALWYGLVAVLYDRAPGLLPVHPGQLRHLRHQRPRRALSTIRVAPFRAAALGRGRPEAASGRGGGRPPTAGFANDGAYLHERGSSITIGIFRPFAWRW